MVSIAGPDDVSELLVGLTDAQRQAILTPDEPLCVVAAAGSGKTRVLAHRVARRVLDGSASADHTIVVTFTRKAAGEVRDRLRRLGAGRVRSGTFHATAYAQLRRYWMDRGQQPPSLLDDPGRLLRDGGVDADEVGEVATEVAWAQSRLVAPDAYPARASEAGRRTALGADDLAAAYQRYEITKRRRGVVDLHDLIVGCADAIERDPVFAAAVRWQVRHLYVDEFQDVNPAQWRLLRAWMGDRLDLFVVGDPNQAIYSWNGADPTLLGRLPDLLPGTTVLRLGDNHRSSPQILRAAAAVLHEDATPAVAGSTPDGPAPVVANFDDDDDEARAVARWLRLAHHPGRPWSHLAVLARTNARLEPVAAALRRAGVPCWVRSSPRQDVTDRHGALRWLRRTAPGTALRAAVAEMADDTPGLAGRSAIIGLAEEMSGEFPEPTVGAFLEWMTATFDAVDGSGDTDPVRDAVQLCTFHRAKGLEWTAVAIVGLEAGIVPIGYARTAEALDEERRLLYVALTRAETELWCSWAARRTVGDRTWRCEPSPYLDAVRGAIDASPHEPAAAARRIAALRDRLPRPA